MEQRRDLVDFHLPDEILAVIPTDPYDQLDVARKITSMAIASRVTRLESDSTRLRQQIAEKDRTVEELQEKVERLDRIVLEYREKLKSALEENAKLTKERDTLSFTAKRLSRNLSKLETFKKQLMQTLSEDNSNSMAESYDMDPYDNIVARIPSWQVQEMESSTSSFGFASGSTISGSSTHNGKELSITPYNMAANPKMLTGPNSPKKSSVDGNGTAMSAWYPTNQTYSAPVSPPNRRSFTGRPHMDGKEFFRQARTRLSYEQFGSFLANVKEFNSSRQSREETLRKAEEIFGTENKDLFISFQNMINRNMS